MKLFLVALSLLFLAGVDCLAQSGRRVKVVPTPQPPVEAPSPTSSPTKPTPAPNITAERNEEYICTEDGTLARVMELDENADEIFTTKTVEVKAEITRRPKPSYTREARRAGVQGYVVLRVVLLSSGEVGRIKVVRGLPAGLTASAIRSACKLEFRPAMKAGKEVSQEVQVEYAFRLSDAAILGP